MTELLRYLSARWQINHWHVTDDATLPYASPSRTCQCVTQNTHNAINKF